MKVEQITYEHLTNIVANQKLEIEILKNNLKKETKRADNAIEDLSDNNEFFSGQLATLNDLVMTKAAENALLKQELRRKNLQ